MIATKIPHSVIPSPTTIRPRLYLQTQSSNGQLVRHPHPVRSIITSRTIRTSHSHRSRDLVLAERSLSTMNITRTSPLLTRLYSRLFTNLSLVLIVRSIPNSLRLKTINRLNRRAVPSQQSRLLLSHYHHHTPQHLSSRNILSIRLTLLSLMRLTATTQLSSRHTTSPRHLTISLRSPITIAIRGPTIITSQRSLLFRLRSHAHEYIFTSRRISDIPISQYRQFQYDRIQSPSSSPGLADHHQCSNIFQQKRGTSPIPTHQYSQPRVKGASTNQVHKQYPSQ